MERSLSEDVLLGNASIMPCPENGGLSHEYVCFAVADLPILFSWAVVPSKSSCLAAVSGPKNITGDHESSFGSHLPGPKTTDTEMLGPGTEYAIP